MTFFVAIDSEGVTLNESLHYTTLVAASTGEYIQSSEGLDTDNIFEFLLNLSSDLKERKPVFCIYGGSYDFNMFLKYIFENDARLLNDHYAESVRVRTKRNEYNIFYIPRKILKISKGSKSIKIFDVIGFFQQSFIDTCKTWLHPDIINSEQFADMVKGKDNREYFNEWSESKVLEYCRIELKYLVLIMELLNEGIEKLDVKMKSWHGAGALGSVLLKKRLGNGKISKELPTRSIVNASLQAFFGGRIELFKNGFHNSDIYEADINSAYPHSISKIVASDDKRWLVREWDYKRLFNIDDFSEFAILKIKWKCSNDSIINPFPYRSSKQKKVFYPNEGIGSYHICEVKEALNFAHVNDCEIYLIESYELFSDEKIFEWVIDDYALRQSIVAESKRTGLPNGLEKCIKLGLNSIYGKICQTAGGDKKRPPFHNIFWAGYITAQTRAKIYAACMTNPSSIIMAATDGVYSTDKLELDYSDKKELGKWDLDKHDSGLFVQSGYYFLCKNEKWKSRTRGFDKLKNHDDIIGQINVIMRAWKLKEWRVYFPCTRFITLPTACTGSNYWKWCRWIKVETDGNIGRMLKLSPNGTKRELSEFGNMDEKLLQTMPILNLTPDVESELYKRGWSDFGEDVIINEEINLI